MDMKEVWTTSVRLLSNFFAVMIILLLFSVSLQAAEYVSLYAYYGRPFYTFGTGSITCEEGLLNDERYQSCEERDELNKYFYTLTGYREIHDLTDTRVICQREKSLNSCVPDSNVSFSLSYPIGTRRLPAAFRLYIPVGTVRVNLSIKMNNSSREGIVLRYQNTPDCYGWPYNSYDAVPWAEKANAGLEEMKAGDVYKPNPGGSIFAVPITNFSDPLTEDGDGWLYIRKLGLDYSNIRTVTFNVTVNTAAFLAWYQHVNWDVNGDPWSPNHEIVNTSPPPNYSSPPSSGSTTTSSYNSPPPSPSYTLTSSGSSSPLSGNEGLFGLFYGVPSSSSSTPTSSSSTDNSGPINTFGLLPAVFSFNSRDEQLSCGPDHLEVCNREACDELGEGYWWYGGSCCSGQQIETYDNGRIAEAPVRLGEDADNGIISAGEGMSILLDVPGNVRTYAVLTFPNGDYFFIDNNDLITKSVVPVTSGELPVSDNLCAALEELPEFKGEWEVVFLTVPSTVEEFQTLNDIVDYMNNGGTYHLGNYSVMLDCQARSNNPLSIFGVFQ